MALFRAIATDSAAREEERRARREDRPINPEQIAYKTNFCRYHSFVVYFSTLQRLSWVEFTGREEPSEFQEH